MGKQIDWRKAHIKPARLLSRQERRLDHAADNWLASQALYRKTQAKAERSKGGKHAR